MATPGQPPLPPSVQTLLIRHLPEGLPPGTLKRLFSHYGASDVRLCNPGRLKGCAFVDFENEAVCVRAQSQLHRLKFLGKTLFVERAKPAPEKDVISGEDPKIANTDKLIEVLNVPPPPPPLPPQQNVLQTGGDPIAPGLGVDYPFPPHLEYAYPPPDGNILTNIVNALIAVPRFYTQVLHLMNKMNLPAPFRAALPTPPLPPPLPPPVPFPSAGKRQAGDLSSGESELESSDEEFVNAVTDDELDGTENEPDSHQSRRKRVKLEAVLGPAVDKDASHEAAGVKPISIVPKNVPIKKNKPVMQIKISPKISIGEGTSSDKSGQVELDAQKEVEDPDRTATREELQAGQLSTTEILTLPMFKNYSPGAPTQVLYIKNLGKEVAPEDLFHVYGAFFANLEEAKATLNVKLMQEGRMRGQAFVTFSSTELAQEALGLTNGYILKGKPMVIHFGRNPSAAKPPIPT